MTPLLGALAALFANACGGGGELDTGKDPAQNSENALRINCGGGALDPGEGKPAWVAGSTYAVGGAPFVLPALAQTSTSPAFAPEQIYGTLRHQEHLYRFPQVEDGIYKIRLHFVDPDPTLERAMDIDIAGQRLLSGYSPRLAAGGSMRAIVEDRVAEVKGGAGLEIACFEGGGQDVFVAGIEILPLPEGVAPDPESPGTQGSAVLPTDLDWLRDRIGDGCLATSDGESIFLTELSTGTSEEIGGGIAPEFSPDGSRIAWIEGNVALGRRRAGEPTVHTIARDIDPRAGVHWLDDEHVLVRFQAGSTGQWARVGLDGEAWPEHPIGDLGTSGIGTDVRPRGTEWSYAADREWATSEGGRGHIGGSASPSLSPDGLSVTALQQDARFCNLTAIRPEGLQRSIHWRYGGSLQHAIFPSSDARFLLCQERESRQTAILEIATGRATAMGKVMAGKYFGADLAVGSGTGLPWPNTNAAPPAAQHVIAAGRAGAAAVVGKSSTPDGWPGLDHTLVFLWESHTSTNTISDQETGRERQAGGRLRGAARHGPHGEISLNGAGYLPDDHREALTSQCVDAGAFSLEITLGTPTPGGQNTGAIVVFGDGEGPNNFLLEDLGGDLWFSIVTDGIKDEPETPSWRLGTLRAGVVQHVLVSYGSGTLAGYIDGEEVFSTTDLQGGLACWEEGIATLAFGRPPWVVEGGWNGQIEAIAIRSSAIDAPSAARQAALAGGRIAGREDPPRSAVEATLQSIAQTPDPTQIGEDRRCLAQAIYKVDLVVAGEVPEEEILVLHWVIEDGNALPWDREPGKRYLLQLEPKESHPELMPERRSGLDPAPDGLPVYLEMGREPVGIADE